MAGDTGRHRAASGRVVGRAADGRADTENADKRGEIVSEKLEHWTVVEMKDGSKKESTDEYLLLDGGDGYIGFWNSKHQCEIISKADVVKYYTEDRKEYE